MERIDRATPDQAGRLFEIILKATLNVVPFYTKLYCQEVGLESVRRHGRDIYVVFMEWDNGHIP